MLHVASPACSVHTYVDGKLSTASTDHKPEDITLHPKFMVMGGGKQTEARGGNVRTIVLYDGALSPAEISETFTLMSNENPLYAKAVMMLQRTVRGFVGRRKARVEKRLAGWVEPEPKSEGEKKGKGGNGGDGEEGGGDADEEEDEKNEEDEEDEEDEENEEQDEEDEEDEGNQGKEDEGDQDEPEGDEDEVCAFRDY